MYPMALTTETRAAARSGSSAAALMPTGKPSEAPSPQNSTAALAATGESTKTTSVSPSAADTALARTTTARPNRSMKKPPLNRPRDIAAAKPA